ncbi:MAG: hypothetical protein LBQ59_04620 [Candidatus Peribacteria bacterium]|nr:hypothetical protein [Candidatus Peribacteria bacterium]
MEKLKSKHQQINLNLSSLKNLPKEKQGELLEKVNKRREKIINQIG